MGDGSRVHNFDDDVDTHDVDSTHPCTHDGQNNTHPTTCRCHYYNGYYYDTDHGIAYHDVSTTTTTYHWGARYDDYIVSNDITQPTTAYRQYNTHCSAYSCPYGFVGRV